MAINVIQEISFVTIDWSSIGRYQSISINLLLSIDIEWILIIDSID